MAGHESDRTPATPSSPLPAGADPSGDSRERQGDKLASAAGGGASSGASPAPAGGDSPKPHGDALKHAVDEAAKG